MKKGKQLNVKLNPKFKTYYGTIDNKELKTIYVGISTWVMPKIDLDDYSKLISQLRQTVKSGVYQNINSTLFRTDHCIIDFDVKGYRIIYGKPSYLNIEITLFVKDKESILSTIIKNDMIRLLTNITSLITKTDDLEFVLSKKNHVVI